jgi:putative redox protein
MKLGVGGIGGFRPHELLEAALATCTTITARMALAERGLDDAGVGVRVEVGASRRVVGIPVAGRV